MREIGDAIGATLCRGGGMTELFLSRVLMTDMMMFGRASRRGSCLLRQCFGRQKSPPQQLNSAGACNLRIRGGCRLSGQWSRRRDPGSVQPQLVPVPFISDGAGRGAERHDSRSPRSLDNTARKRGGLVARSIIWSLLSRPKG